MEKIKKYGIETVKKHLKDVSSIVKDVKEAIEDDGKIKGSEIFALLPNAYKLLKIINNAKILSEEIKDLDEDELKEIASILNVEAKDVFAKYEKEINLVSKSANFILQTYKNGLEIVNDFKSL